MKKLLVVLVLVLGSVSLMAQGKVASVNSQSLLDSLPSYQDAIVYLKAKEVEGATELQTMQSNFQKNYEKFLKEQADMPPVVREHEEKKLMEEDQAIQQKSQSLQAGLQQLAQKMNEPILTKVQDAVKAVSKSSNYDYVIDQSMLLYFNDTYDITPKVLAELLKMEGAE